MAEDDVPRRHLRIGSVKLRIVDRRSGQRQFGALLLLGATTALILTISAAPAWSACPPPEIAVSPSSGSPRSQITVTGQRFFVGCNDFQTVVPGQSPSPPPPEHADGNIRIEFIQGSRVWTLTTISATSDYTFKVMLTVPAEAATGPSSVRATGSNGTPSAGFSVVASSRSSELPRTGSNLDLALVGATASVTILVGWILILRGRARQC